MASGQPFAAADLGRIRSGNPKTQGIALGRRSAQAILALRAHDGSAHAEMRVDVDYVPSTMPGIWRQDPVSRSPVILVKVSRYFRLSAVVTPVSA